MNTVLSDILKVAIVSLGMSPLVWLSSKHNVRVVSSLVSDLTCVLICQVPAVRVFVAVSAAVTAYGAFFAPEEQKASFRAATENASKKLRDALGMNK